MSQVSSQPIIDNTYQKPDNQMMYVVGGIIVAGIVYFMFIKK